MSAGKHTPGPLEVREGGNYVALGRAGFNATADREHCIGHGAGGLAEAMLPHGYTPEQFAEALANMRLFAAAPDLLSALEKLLAHVRAISHQGARVIESEEIAAEAAIAKAVGK